MRTIASLTMVFFAVPAALFAQSTSAITFNEYPIGTSVSDQYAHLGAVFASSTPTTAPIIVDVVVSDGGQAADYVSPPGGLWFKGDNDFLSAVTLTVSFVVPGAPDRRATVTTVSMTFMSDVAGFGSLRAFDASDQEVAFSGSTIGGQQLEVLTVSAPAISYVQVSGFRDVVIDQLAFDEPRGNECTQRIAPTSNGCSVNAAILQLMIRGIGRFPPPPFPESACPNPDNPACGRLTFFPIAPICHAISTMCATEPVLVYLAALRHTRIVVTRSSSMAC